MERYRRQRETPDDPEEGLGQSAGIDRLPLDIGEHEVPLILADGGRLGRPKGATLPPNKATDIENALFKINPAMEARDALYRQIFDHDLQEGETRKFRLPAPAFARGISLAITDPRYPYCASGSLLREFAFLVRKLLTGYLNYCFNTMKFNRQLQGETMSEDALSVLLPGDRVQYLWPRMGQDYAKLNAAHYLVHGEVYTVDRTQGSMGAEVDVYLVEIPGKPFNRSQFEKRTHLPNAALANAALAP